MESLQQTCSQNIKEKFESLERNYTLRGITSCNVMQVTPQLSQLGMFYSEVVAEQGTS